MRDERGPRDPVSSCSLSLSHSRSRRPRLRFRTIGELTGADTAAGTWTGAGLIEGTGTYTEMFRFAGGTIHAQKVLVGSGGTIVLETRGVIVWRDVCIVGFKAGSWHVSEATGTYAGLNGGGTPNATLESFGNVCTGAIDVIHLGAVHDA